MSLTPIKLQFLLNCTAHSQVVTRTDLRILGYEVEISPRVNRVRRNRHSGKVEVGDLELEAIRVAEEIPKNSHCLVGGAGPLVERLSLLLLKKDCVLYSITSERKSKRNGGFKFNVLGIDETPLSHDYHNGLLDINDE